MEFVCLCHHITFSSHTWQLFSVPKTCPLPFRPRPDSDRDIEGPTSCTICTETRLRTTATANVFRVHQFLGMSYDIGHFVLRYTSGKLLEISQWPPSRSATAQVWVRDSRSVAVGMAFGRYLHFPLDSSFAPSRSLLPPRCEAAGTTKISLALSYTQEVWCVSWLRWTSGSPSIVLCLVYLSALRDTHRDQLSLRQQPVSIYSTDLKTWILTSISAAQPLCNKGPTTPINSAYSLMHPNTHLQIYPSCTPSSQLLDTEGPTISVINLHNLTYLTTHFSSFLAQLYNEFFMR